jgi:hypothetical protein
MIEFYNFNLMNKDALSLKIKDKIFKKFRIKFKNYKLNDI